MLKGGLLVLLVAAYSQAKILNECRRGVRRAHPTQENGYQVFSRDGWRSQWIDQECPQYQIYSQDACDCLGGLPPPTTTALRTAINHHRTTTTTTTTTRAPPPPATKPLPTPAQSELMNDGPNCNFHQPHPDNLSMYARKTENGWITEDCNWPFYTGLIWDQSTCRCEWGPDRSFPARRMDQNEAPASPCITMLNMTFDTSIEEVSRGLWLKRNHPEGARIVEDATAVGGGCALFKDSSVSIPFFKSNTLGKEFQISFRFKSCKQQDPSGEITLIHNGCAEVKKLPPTLRVAYRPWSREFTMEFEAANDVQPTREGCTLSGAGFGWNDVDIRYENNYLEVNVNGALCISTSVFSGDIKTTDCPLSLPGNKACVHLDEVLITRGCSRE